MTSTRQLLGLLLALAFCGCRSVESQPRNAFADSAGPNRPANFSEHTRNNSASLLFDLLNEERHLSKVLIVKRESEPLRDLVKRISATAADGAAGLERLADADASLHLDVLGLPSGEAATRDAIAKTKQHGLLQSSGREFEFQLLLTQAEALNYGAHLARVAAENESQADPRRYFFGLRTELKGLHDEVLAMLRGMHSAAK